MAELFRLLAAGDVHLHEQELRKLFASNLHELWEALAGEVARLRKLVGKDESHLD